MRARLGSAAAVLALAALLGAGGGGRLALGATGGHFVVAGPTSTWADYAGTLTINGQSAEAGDEVGVFNPRGVCCGAARVTSTGRFGWVHVYGDDPSTPADEGAGAGERLSFRVWDASTQTEYGGAHLSFGAAPALWQPDGQAPDVAISVTLSAPSVLLSASDAKGRPQDLSGPVTLKPGHQLIITVKASASGALFTAADGPSHPRPPAGQFDTSGGGQGTYRFMPDFNMGGQTFQVTFTGSRGAQELEPQTVTIVVPEVVTSVGEPRTVTAEELPATGKADVTPPLSEDEETLLPGFKIKMSRAALEGATDGAGEPVASLTLTCGLIDPEDLPSVPAGRFGVVLHLGPEGTHFGAPIKVTVPYEGTLPQKPIVECFDLATGTWKSDGVTFVSADRVAHTLTFKTTHFSVFAAADEEAQATEPDTPGGDGTLQPSSAQAEDKKWTDCFIATAAFGSPLERHVRLLRQFRDHCLLASAPGRALVGLYYRLSPPLAGFIAASESLRALARMSLYPIAGLAALILHTALWTWLALLAASLLPVACSLRARRRARI